MMALTDHRTPWTLCPWCAALFDAALAAQEGADPPADGDVAVCSRCHALAIYDATVEGGQRRPTPAELDEMDTDPRIRRIVAITREANRRLGRGAP